MSLLETVGQPFRHEAENRNLTFNIDVDGNLARSMVTDSKRLQQVLKNLLSNAFKFTAEGRVRLTVSAAVGGWVRNIPCSIQRLPSLRSKVSDTGIGIPLEKQKLIFEAFQQADIKHQPEIWQHRSVLPSAVNWQACSAAVPSAQRAEEGQHLHAVPAALKYSGPTVAPRAAADRRSPTTVPNLAGGDPGTCHRATARRPAQS